MSGLPPALVVLVPLLAAAAAWAAPSAAIAAWLSAGGATGAFLLAAALPWWGHPGGGLLADPLAIHMAILAAFVGMTGAWLARPYWALEHAEGRADAATARRGHALYPALLAALLLALLADSLALMWAGLAACVVLLVAAMRLGGAIAAGWRLFLAGGAALALVLLGALLLGPADALSWTLLADSAPAGNGAVLGLGFAMLLLGCATLAGLAPLHGALLAAQAEGPAPLTLGLGGLLPVAALVALLRARSLVASSPAAFPPGESLPEMALLTLGLLSLVLAALTPRRHSTPEKFLAVIGLAQFGVVAFAFGLGTGAATFAGLLHLTLFTLLRAALAQGMWRAAQLKGGADLGGLLGGHRALALTLAAGLAALSGLPPFGLFTSLFLVVMETTRQMPLLAAPLIAALGACAWALGGRIVVLCRHPATPDLGPAPPPAALLPAWLHLGIVAVLGLAMPPAMVEWLATIARALR